MALVRACQRIGFTAAEPATPAAGYAFTRFMVKATLEVLDWRRQIWALYAEVRRLSRDDPAVAHHLWREGRDDLFKNHPASPLPDPARRDFAGLPVAPYDPGWRFQLPIEEAAPVTIELTAGSDGEVPFERIGRLSLPVDGTLDVWRLETYGGGVFLPVRDSLAGRPGGTYGGGRYLLDTIKGADLGPGDDGTSLVIDFNFAYNPSCAYDTAWACPLAPAGNILAVDIPAGELYESAPG
jgi:uncharacterized protein (DUF1684 family)